MSEPLINSPSTRFEVRDPLEIRHLLNRLVQARALLTIHQSPGNIVLLSTILGIDETTGTLLLDTNADVQLNRQAMQTPDLHCAGNLERIEVRFGLTPLRLDSTLDPPVFRTAIPKELVYLQRREYFRLLAPAHDELNCLLEPPDEAPNSGRSFLLPVIDLSSGGLALRVPEAADPMFNAGTRFPRCRLRLPQTGTVEAELLVRHVGEYHSGKGQVLHHAGCEWQGMPMGMQNLIQRYVMRVERERVARERGML